MSEGENAKDKLLSVTSNVIMNNIRDILSLKEGRSQMNVINLACYHTDTLK